MDNRNNNLGKVVYVSRKVEYAVLIAIVLFCGIHTTKTAMDFTITSRNLAWGIGTLLLFLMITARAMEGKVDLSILKRLIFPVYAGLFLASLFSVTQAINKGEAWYYTFRIVPEIAFLFCATVIISESDVNGIIKSIVLLALGLGGYGIYQYFTIDNPAVRTGTMANMNLCSTAHLLMIPFSIYAWRYSKIWKILGTVAVVVAIFIILFSLRTRSTWVALFVMSFVATCRKKKLLLIMMIFFVLAATGIYLIRGNNVFYSESILERFDLWLGSMRMLKDNLLGIGAGNWRINIVQYARYMTLSEAMKTVAFCKVYFQRAHNDWVQMVSELGVQGFILYLSLFILSIYYAIKAKSVLIYSCLTAYMVDACFSFPRERTFYVVFSLILMAIATKLSHNRKPVYKLKFSYLGSVLILAGVSFAVVIFGIRYKTECKVFKMIHARQKQQWHILLSESENISRFSTLDSFCTPLLVYRGIGNYAQRDFSRAVTDFQRAYDVNPNHVQVLTQLAQLWNIHARPDMSKKYYEEALNLFPGNQQATDGLRKTNERIVAIERKKNNEN
jgi:O-antigen ligase